ncbi:hypothetical protein HDU87_007976 [Geranomyces variabilis]|uniref:C2H2-type domain-containing protein n=1 Tax=Geranomyces variabilis TaxID=109894 RepID=A0AAD5TP16_9FUNG|nr:hypothetical protein HDU87_007976 [Geranomyces variabilis]
MPARDADFMAWAEAYPQHGRKTRHVHAHVIRQLVGDVAQRINPSWQVEIRGSLSKGTDVVGSDMDLVVCGGEPATKSHRKQLADALTMAVQNSGVVIQYNAVSISDIFLSNTRHSCDICFGRTDYADGRLHAVPVTTSSLKQNQNVAAVVCAFKYLALQLNKPRLSGSAWEQLVLATYETTRCKSVWTLFELVLKRFNMTVAADLTRWVNVHALDKMHFNSLMSQGEMSNWREYSTSLNRRVRQLKAGMRLRPDEMDTLLRCAKPVGDYVPYPLPSPSPSPPLSASPSPAPAPAQHNPANSLVPFACPDCPKRSYKTPDALQAHRAASHGVPNPLPSPSPVLSLSPTPAPVPAQHNPANSLVPFACPDCPKRSYKTPDALQAHRAASHGVLYPLPSPSPSLFGLSITAASASATQACQSTDAL